MLTFFGQNRYESPPMAEGERKKPKIDLKTRIPSKTVKGLTPAPGGAIPPPPGAVPAPPPDLLGKPKAPKISADPNDPLGAAKVEGDVAPQQQIVVVHAHEEGHGATSKKGTVIAMIVGALAVGLGIGFISGQAKKGSDIASKAKTDAKEISDKVVKTNDNLGKFLESLKTAKSELQNAGQVSQPTIDAIKGWSSGFSSADLKGREIAFFGEDTAGKLITWANRVNYIDELRAGLTKGSGLEGWNARLKGLQLPKDSAKWGVKINKPGDGKDDPPITIADIVDLGDNVKYKDKAAAYDMSNAKEPKLKAKTPLEIWPGGKTDFFEKGFISIIDSKSWGQVCQVYPQAFSDVNGKVDLIISTIEGQGDDPGTLKPGKDLSDKLKTLAK